MPSRSHAARGPGAGVMPPPVITFAHPHANPSIYYYLIYDFLLLTSLRTVAVSLYINGQRQQTCALFDAASDPRFSDAACTGRLRSQGEM